MRAVRTGGAVPPALALLLGVVAILGVAWALLVPLAQSPDEDAHFGYAQVLAEDFRLPDEKPGPTYTSEHRLVAERARSFQTAQLLDSRTEWSALAEADWDRLQARLPRSARRRGGHADEFSGANAARTNPPAYYLLQAIPYRLAGGDVVDRWYAMRLFSVLLLLVAVAATWLLIGELTGRRRLLQLVGAAAVGLQPMELFIASSINPDAALMATWALAFWLGARILIRELTLPAGVALASVTALAILTKATSYALVPGVVTVFAVALSRERPRLGRFRLPAVASAAALGLPVLAWLVLSRSLDRAAVNAVAGGGGADAGPAVDVSLVNYLWQFYLPKLPFQTGIPPIERLPVFDVWVETGWGAFGWLEVRFPEPLYVLLGLLTAAVLLAGAVVLVRRRRPAELAVAAFMAVVTLTLLAGLHWVEYRSIVYDATSFNQGRYLLPVLPILGAAAAAALTLLPVRARPAVAGAALGGLFILQAASLAVVAARFYA